MGEKIEAIYLGFGWEYVVMATVSALSLKRYNPHIIISIVVNKDIILTPFLKEVFSRIVYVDEPDEYNRFYKTKIFDYIVGDKVIFLDSDTLIQGALDPIFYSLDRFDCALTINPQPSGKKFAVSENIEGHDFPLWNSGVIFFRKSESVKSFFYAWHNKWLESEKKNDMPPLAQAIYESPDLKILSLGLIWNASYGLMDYSKFLVKPKIWHYKFPDYDRTVCISLKEAANMYVSDKYQSQCVIENMKVVYNKYHLAGGYIFHTRFARSSIGKKIIYFACRLKLIPSLKKDGKYVGGKYDSISRS